MKYILKHMELCKSRHEIQFAIDGAIFDTTVNPLDVMGLEEHAKSVLMGINGLTLYVTGLTVALVAVINACRALGIELTLMHYDRESDSYYPQEVPLKWMA